jgi:peptidoglycan/LPS O-acetylase OafA/YrhL
MWTLVIEVQFYAILPLLFLALKRASPKTCLWVVTLVFLLIPVSVQIMAGWHPTFYPKINSYFPSSLDSFYLGVLLAGLENMSVVRRRWAQLGILGVILWALALFGLAWMATHIIGENSLIYQSLVGVEKIASGCLLCYIANPQHPMARLLCTPVLRWCGLISYEWYLIHQPVTLWARHIFGSTNGAFLKYVAIVGGSFVFSLAIAALVYRYFSLPILKMGRAGK